MTGVQTCALPIWNELLASEDIANRSDHHDDTGLRFKPANEPDFIPVPSTLTPIAPMVASASDRAIHGQTWKRRTVAKRRQVLTLAIIALSGSLFAIGCFVVFMQMVGGKSKPIAEVPAIASSQPVIDKADSNVSMTPDPTISTDGEIGRAHV